MEASDSGEKEIGDYIVSYAIEEAAGLYHLSGGLLLAMLLASAGLELCT